MPRQIDELSVQEKRDLVSEIGLKKSGRSDKDWIELRNEFDLEMSPETLRKAGVGVKLVADADIYDGYAERQKLRDMTAQVNEMYRSEARNELLREEIFSAVSKLKPLSPVYRVPVLSSSNRELVLCMGDVHYGADIRVKGLQGETLNEYNDEVFDIRMKDLFNQIACILAKENVSKLHLFLVGDLIDGMLRQSQLVKLQYGLVDSTIKFSEYMANWIDSLSGMVDVNVACCSGNHSEIRPLGSKKRQFPEENMERIISWFLKARLDNNDRITVDDRCDAYNLQNVLGYSFLLLHGDSEKTIPQLAAVTISLYAKPVDFFICGHKHRDQEFPIGSTPDGHSTVIRVPSICGADTYATSKGYGGKAGAVAIVMEEGYGRRCQYPINLK